MLIISCNLPLVAFSLWGAIRLYNVDVQYVDNVNLRLVQPNISQKEKWDPQRSARQNLAAMGLSANPNEAVGGGKVGARADASGDIQRAATAAAECLRFGGCGKTF